MLYKSTLKLLVVETETKELLVPIVTNSYRKTLWLLRHREPTVRVVGIIEGPASDIGFMQVGEIDISTLLNQVIRTTNAIYTSIGTQPELPKCFELDYTKDLTEFIISYSNIFTPDELLIVLGIGHNKLFKLIGNLVEADKLNYTPLNGPGKWSYYDYFWLNEKYKGGNPRLLDIKPFINRTNLQIKLRAYSVGFNVKVKKKAVSSVNVTLQDIEECDKVKLSAVERDYIISQIIDIVSNIVNHNKGIK